MPDECLLEREFSGHLTNGFLSFSFALGPIGTHLFSLSFALGERAPGPLSNNLSCFR